MLLRRVDRCCGYSSPRLSRGCRACPSLRDASLRETPSFHSVLKRSYYEIIAEINSNVSITSVKLIWQMARDLWSFRYERTCGYRIGKRSKRWQTLPDASPANSRLPLSNVSLEILPLETAKEKTLAIFELVHFQPFPIFQTFRYLPLEAVAILKNANNCLSFRCNNNCVYRDKRSTGNKENKREQ